MNEQHLEQLVREVLQEMTGRPERPPRSSAPDLNSFEAPDVSALDLQRELYVENPADREAYLDMKQASPARLGVGRAGPRPHYKTLLRFRADHAAAMDAVFTDVSDEIIQEMGFFKVKSAAADKAQYLMDPPSGREFDAETKKLIQESCKAGAQVQILVSDGLSSTAVADNIRDVFPALLQGLKVYGLSVGSPLFIQYGRVGIMDAVSDILKPEVTIILLGERPGLVTNASLSAYMTYKGGLGMAESARTVVSNIYQKGTPPSEAGAHIAEIAKKMIDNKASGLDLKL